MNELNILPYADLTDDELISAVLCQSGELTKFELELVERLERANSWLAEYEDEPEKIAA